MIGPIHSAGGPYLVIPAQAAAAWHGFAERATYEALGKHSYPARVTQIDGAAALVLGSDRPLYYHSLADGGVFAIVEFFDADDDALLAEMLEDLPRSGWKAIAGTVSLGPGGLRAFDSALRGSDIGNDALTIDLSPGCYAVATCIFAPDDTTELLLTRLRAERAPGKGGKVAAGPRRTRVRR